MPKQWFIAMPLTTAEQRSELITEHLRYADAIHVSEDRKWIAMTCPKGMNGLQWAKSQTARLASFQRLACAYEGYSWQDIPAHSLTKLLMDAENDPKYSLEFAQATGEPLFTK